MRLAILGATSHIALNLISYLPHDVELVLFARRPDAIPVTLIRKRASPTRVEVVDAFPEFQEEFLAVINCVGFGTPEKVRNGGVEVFRVTERFDEMVLRYISTKPLTRYVNFSSGIVHNITPSNSISHLDEFSIDLDQLSERDAYRVAKLNSEAKHRTMKNFCIFDLRVFGFFTRFIDLNSSYLMSQIVRGIMNGEEFVTDKSDITRDFLHPRDLTRAVLECVDAKPANCAMDLYSKAPVKKSEILRCFQDRYGLRTRVSSKTVNVSPTREKAEYVPRGRQAGRVLGYEPTYTSLESLVEEADAIIEYSSRDNT